MWKRLRDSLLKSTDVVCGWTMGPARHKETWWWNKEVDVAVKCKSVAWKSWRAGAGSKESYLEAKRAARRAVYKAKKEAEQARFAKVLRNDCQSEVFKVARQIIKANLDVVGEKCVRGDDGSLAFSDEEKKAAWRSHYMKLLNNENVWCINDLPPANPVEGPAVEVQKGMVEDAIRRMKCGKAAGPSGIVAEMLKASDECGLVAVTELINQIIYEGSVPEEWQLSTLVNLYKGKGDSLERNNYRGLKLMDQVLKVMERVLEKLLRKRISIDAMQFGFMPGRGTTDAIFTLRQMQEKFLAHDQRLYLAFIDLEKAFDRVPREVVWWALRRLGVEEWLVRAVQSTYVNARSRVRVSASYSEEFPIRVGVHQGSVLSPLLFIAVLEALTQGFRSGCPYEMMYADDLVIAGRSMDELMVRFESWRRGLEAGGLKVNVQKTKVLVSGRDIGKVTETGSFPCSVCCRGVGSNSIFCNSCRHWVHKRCSGIKGRLRPDAQFQCKACNGNKSCSVPTEETVSCEGGTLNVVQQFCYLGDTISARGGVDCSITVRIRSAWHKFRELLPLLTSRTLPLRTKGRLYNACVRSVLLYGSETWALRVEDLVRLERNDRRMIRWMCGVSFKDGQSMVRLHEWTGLSDLRACVQSRRLRWYGHVERMDPENCVKKIRELAVAGARPRGRPRRTWEEVVARDLSERGVCQTLAQDRRAWRAITKPRPTQVSLENGR